MFVSMCVKSIVKFALKEVYIPVGFLSCSMRAFTSVVVEYLVLAIEGLIVFEFNAGFLLTTKPTP